MFDVVVPGADSPVTGLVTVLAAANLLTKMVREKKNGRNVMFLIFNGESYDYIGSSRVVYDMERGDFPVKRDADGAQHIPPMNLSHIGLFIELNQVSFLNNQQLVFHTSEPQMNEVRARSQVRNYVI